MRSARGLCLVTQDFKWVFNDTCKIWTHLVNTSRTVERARRNIAPNACKQAPNLWYLCYVIMRSRSQTNTQNAFNVTILYYHYMARGLDKWLIKRVEPRWSARNRVLCADNLVEILSVCVCFKLPWITNLYMYTNGMFHPVAANPITRWWR